jgi:two-component system response regulator MprA
VFRSLLQRQVRSQVRPLEGLQGKGTVVAARLLVVDMDRSMSEALELAGFDVVAVPSAPEALRAAATDEPDALVVDTDITSAHGLALCRELREVVARAPLLAVGSSDTVADRIAVLEAGADDYIVKPFALAELLARVRVLLRRTAATGGNVLRHGDLVLDPGAHEVRRGERRIGLTPIEFRLLHLLMDNPGRVIDRSTIFMHVWGFDFGPSSNLLNVYVGYLRRKTEAGGESRLIHTVRGVGYVLRGEESSSDS